MPIYEYGCQKCGRQHEVAQKISDKPLTRCPSCKGKLTRLISASAIQFKGTGWYVTDYAKKGAGAGKKDGERAAPGDKAATGEKAAAGEKTSDKKEGGSKAAAAPADD